MFAASHLQQGTGYIAPLAVVDTLVRLLKSGPASASIQHLGVTGLVATELLQCFKQMQASVDLNQGRVGLELWLTQELFLDYLSQVSFSELPEAGMTQHFPDAARKLCTAGLAIEWHNGFQSNLSAQFRQAGQPLVLWGCPAQRGDGWALRFPYFGPLMAVLEFFLARGAPSEWWLEQSCPEPQLRQQQAALELACAGLEQAVVSAIGATSNGRRFALVWTLLEEWAMSQRWGNVRS